VTAAECVMCARVTGQGPLFIADLGTSRVYLNEDQYFPGWVFVVLKRHAVELYDLDARERAALIEDVNRVAQALAQVYHPVKMNYELLGNQVPHIHWHLVPRLADDPEPRWPVWRAQHDPKPLPGDEVARRIAQIRAALAQPRAAPG
jgi:diadenosine tetraphosphate (Ap4A) HIT family hydrolase